jgi:hypothetical protein
VDGSFSTPALGQNVAYGEKCRHQYREVGFSTAMFSVPAKFDANTRTTHIPTPASHW